MHKPSTMYSLHRKFQQTEASLVPVLSTVCTIKSEQYHNAHSLKMSGGSVLLKKAGTTPNFSLHYFRTEDFAVSKCEGQLWYFL